MKTLRLLAIALTLGALGTVAYFADEAKSPAAAMAEAADNLLVALTPEQKAKATFAFDDKERTNWIFVPMQDSKRQPTRKGLRLEEMTDGQQKAVLGLLKTGLSDRGFEQAVTIMSLESVLADLEKSGAMVRNPGWYFVSIFGTPGRTGKWGWRIEGHHLSVNYTIHDGEVVSATPMLFASNPNEMKTGPRAGQRLLKDVEDTARDLFKSLDEAQQKVALQEKPFGEPTQHAAAEKPGAPVGLAAARMTAAQKAKLEAVLSAYTGRMPAAVAAAEWKRLTAAGMDGVHFAYTGSLKDGEPHTYRLQGPTFIVQFLNVQADSAKNPANHIHSCWRMLPGDFGLQP